MQEREIASRIAGFISRWHYEFDLKGQRTPADPPEAANRHRQRKRYFFDPMVKFYGGTLAGKRVLDLGCNAGFWSLLALEAGCDFVHGIDGRSMRVEQARFVMEAKEIEPRRYHFEAADLFRYDCSKLSDFDLVLCLGLFYHVSRPLELMERIAAANTDLLIIDTNLCRATEPFWRQTREALDDPRNAVDRELVFTPSRKAMAELAEAFGYAVEILKPEFTDWTGAGDFRNGSRRAFICSKSRPLDAFPAATESVDHQPYPGWWSRLKAKAERSAAGRFAR